MYKPETGERVEQRGRPQRRVVPPPCDKCLKESPTKESEHVLSDRNWRTLELYRRSRATGGACLNAAEREDALLAANFAVVDRIVRHGEQKQMFDAIQLLTLGSLGG